MRTSQLFAVCIVFSSIPAQPNCRANSILEANAFRIEALIKEFPLWSNVASNNQKNASKMYQISERISRYNTDEIRLGFEKYSKRGEAGWTYQLYILVRAIFEVKSIKDSSGKETVPFFDGVSAPGTYDPRWPVRIGDRKIIVYDGPGAYSGPPYAALEEFDFFSTHFDRRKFPATKPPARKKGVPKRHGM